MSFLQPALLLALPVILLPIVIHLINQRRFQTVPWAAMQFLLAANRVSQGYARIRRWLILAARMAAIAGLVFAISRPLSSGWLGLAGGGKIDTAIVLLDRSPSMTMRDSQGRSKLGSSLDKVIESLNTLEPARIVLVDSVNRVPIDVGSASELRMLHQSQPSAVSADLPAMLAVVSEYVSANQPSRCDVWVCTDMRRNDWNPDSGQWDVVRQSIKRLPQSIRFHLLEHAATTTTNRTLRLSGVERVESRGEPQLLMTLNIRQDEPLAATASIPVQLELNGARSEIIAPLTGSDTRLGDQLVPLDANQTRGWGRVAIMADAVPADNDFFFVYDRPIERKTVIVASPDSTTNRSLQPLQFAASGSSETGVVCSHTTVSEADFVATELDDVALVLWNSMLPSESEPSFALLESFAKRGGQIIFFPPPSPTGNSFAGMRWTEWKPVAQAGVASWVGDQDLLGNTLVGAALPVGELRLNRACGLSGDFVTLAQIETGLPLLARSMDYGRNVYFCGTTVAPDHSTLAENGVVLYAMIHRALDKGVQSLGATGMLIAGDVSGDDGADWERIAGDPRTLSTEFPSMPGVYQVGGRLVAINRSFGEDSSTLVDDTRVAELFDGLDVDRVQIGEGDQSSLVQEIWRLCLILMLAALIAEAALCIPRRQRTAEPQPIGALVA